LLVAAAAAVLAAAAVVVVFATRGSPAKSAPVVVYPDSVAVIDPSSNEVVDDVLVGDYPMVLAAEGRYVYVCNNGDATVSQIVLATRKVYGVFALSRAIDMTADGGDLWARRRRRPGTHAPGSGERHGARIPARTVPKTIRVGPSVIGTEEQTTLAADGPASFAVWVGNQDTATVREIDRTLGKTVLTIHGVAPGGLAVLGAASEVTVWASVPTHDLVVRIDAQAGRVVQRIRSRTGRRACGRPDGSLGGDQRREARALADRHRDRAEGRPNPAPDHAEAGHPRRRLGLGHWLPLVERPRREPRRHRPPDRSGDRPHRRVDPAR
jgi:hypothetical protein